LRTHSAAVAIIIPSDTAAARLKRRRFIRGFRTHQDNARRMARTTSMGRDLSACPRAALLGHFARSAPEGKIGTPSVVFAVRSQLSGSALRFASPNAQRLRSHGGPWAWPPAELIGNRRRRTRAAILPACSKAFQGVP